MLYFLQQLINGVTLGAMYGLIAIGYSMVYGIIGMINFAHGEIYMIGAFLSIISFTLLGMLGITWVPLAAVRDPALVLPAIAGALQVDPRSSGDPADRVAEALDGKRALVLLDNLEHVIDAAASLAGLVERTRSAELLVTSREPLLVAAEHEYPLAPLDSDDAVRLFVARARAIRPHFESSEVKPRTVHSVELMPTATGVTLRFVGEGFARYMVRMLVGGMTVVSRGLAPLELFKDGLFHQKNFKCPTAPPEPLTLWNVGYPPELDPFTPDERAAFVWNPEK